MVGVKTSKGCATCLMRSIKCDEKRPSCSQCRRGGRTCPGYQRPMTFVDEGKKMRTQERHSPQETTRSVSCKKDRYHRPKFKKKESPPILWQDDVPVTTGQEVSRSSKEGQLVLMASPRAEQDQLVSSFIATMFPLGTTSMQTSLFGTWLWHIPPRLGVNAALDYAALAVALAYFGRTTRDSLALKGAESSYGAALQNLAVLLEMESKQFQPEVLCATMLLGHYELFAGTSHAWIRHAGGASRLMRLRGARRSYESAFEYSMFLTSRGSIIAEAILSKQPCFLEQAAWQAVPDGLITFPLLPKDAVLYHRIFCHYASIPGLLEAFGEVTYNTSQDRISNLLSESSALCEKMKEWYTDYLSFDGGYRTPVLIEKLMVTEDDSMFERVYVYYDTISAANITAYYAYRLLVQHGMDTLQPGAYSADNIRLAESICMSVDYLSRLGYCGATVLRLSLPIAQLVLPAKYQAWIMSKITALSQSQHELDLLPGISSVQ